MQSQSRYQINYNPLHVLMETTVFKSTEVAAQEREVETILQKDLIEEFSIGGHEDFDYLLNNIYCESDYDDDKHREKDIKLCSVFIDLRNFTKRALFVETENGETIEEIASLKQRAISTWIKLARYYQGHIHSITGDGLMILFGGKQPQDIDEWTVGARAFLLALRILESTDILNNDLKERLKEKGLEDYSSNSDNLLDIKVGVEYSPNTLINAQGVVVNNKAIGEVKATAFEVDFSAKLLSCYTEAKNNLEDNPKYGRVLMIGEKYIELMQFNDKVDLKKLSSTYTRTMFGNTIVRTYHYLDCKKYKDEIITLEDVAGICDVYISGDEMKIASIGVFKEKDKIQHG